MVDLSLKVFNDNKFVIISLWYVINFLEIRKTVIPCRRFLSANLFVYGKFLMVWQKKIMTFL